jgi:predicted metal-dependent enzyme (double-stranded beta helix superfamily)
MLQARPAELESRRRPAISASALSYPVAQLMAEIGDACDGPADTMGDRIAHALRVAAAMPDLLTAELRAPRAGCYARHIVAADPAGRFTLLSIVWGPGQFSPPHAHDTWCAYAVAENTLTETLYEFDAPSGKAVATGLPMRREPGYACFAPAGLEQIHRLGNATGVGAISLHAYGVEGSRVGTHVNRLMDVAERER